MPRPLSLRRIEHDPLDPIDVDCWPATLGPVRHLLENGLDLGAVTVLTGDNGAGKSTIVEAIAIAYGLNAEGGTTAARHVTRATESDLGHHLRLVREPGAPQQGFFLRAETMHGLSTYLEEIGASGDLHALSHGESFLEILTERSRIRGLWLFDEPESALSLSGCLALIGILRDLVATGSQVILSTHSPVLAAVPGARLLELDAEGWHDCAYDDLGLVRTWRAFLDAPERFLRHLG